MDIACNMSNTLLLLLQVNMKSRLLHANVYKQVLNVSILSTKSQPLIMLHQFINISLYQYNRNWEYQQTNVNLAAEYLFSVQRKPLKNFKSLKKIRKRKRNKKSIRSCLYGDKPILAQCKPMVLCKHWVNPFMTEAVII